MSRQAVLHQRAIERLTLQVEELRERAEILERFTAILKKHPEATENDFDRYAKQADAFGYGDYSPETRAMPFDAVRHWLEVNTYSDDETDVERNSTAPGAGEARIVRPESKTCCTEPS